MTSEDEGAKQAIDQIGRDVASLQGIVVREDGHNLQRFGYATGWMIRMIRTANAIAQLHATNYSGEASPLVRSVLEHSVAMRWLADSGDQGPEIISHAHRKHQRNLERSLEAGDWDMSKFIDDTAEDEPIWRQRKDDPENYDQFAQFQQMCTSVGLADIYAAFRLESAFSHPGYSSAASYVLSGVLDDETVEVKFVVPGLAGVPLTATSTLVARGKEAYDEIVAAVRQDT